MFFFHLLALLLAENTAYLCVSVFHSYAIYTGRNLKICNIVHSTSNSFFQFFSYIIDMVHQNSMSVHFRRANTDSGGPIRIQEV